MYLVEQSALAQPAIWLAETATGQLALIVATIAVASVGFTMLDGRLDWRRGVRVLLGCFLLFGATSISAAFLQFGQNAPALAESSSTSSEETVTALPKQVDDPWAAASLKPGVAASDE